MLGSTPLVALGQLSSTNRFRAGIVSIVSCQVIPGTTLAVLTVTTIAGETDALEHDAADMITIDLDAPASAMMAALGKSKSSVMRALFGGAA